MSFAFSQQAFSVQAFSINAFAIEAQETSSVSSGRASAFVWLGPNAGQPVQWLGKKPKKLPTALEELLGKFGPRPAVTAGIKLKLAQALREDEEELLS